MNLRIKKIKKNKDIISIVFEKPKNLFFYPGQYLDIKLPVKDLDGNTRAFTISTSPTEDYIMITTRKGTTPFKNLLEQLKVGDIVESSHPAGTFTLDESSPAVFIAGGIGITPFRSMIKYAIDNKLKTKITLIYSNSGADFLFKEELNIWQNSLDNLKIHYFNTKTGKRIYINFLRLPIYDIRYTIYYLAGSHSFLNDIAQILIDSGLDETNIRYDRFDGY